MLLFVISFTIILLGTVNTENHLLRRVSDDDFMQLIKDKEKLIVLFTKPDCEPCNKIEHTLEGLQEDFNKHLNADIVKISNSNLARLYSPTKEPALVFFRHGIPLLYSGNDDENEVYSFFDTNQTPAVKELTDNIFEHLTQAATGATTGDWFVMFYGASCVECQRLHAVWEGVGAILRGRINVARIDANLAGASTAKRFKISKLPSFLLFRQGKLYRYHLPKYDIKSFVSFAQDWYKNARIENVPLLASPFDDVVDWCVAFIKLSISFGLDLLAAYPWVWQIGLAGFGLVFLTGLIALLKADRSKTKSKEAKTDKKSK